MDRQHRSAEAARPAGRAAPPPGRRSEAIFDFPSWLAVAESRALLDALEQLQRDGHGFHLSLLARDGRVVRATGWALGGGLALRIRPAFSQAPVEAPPAASPGEPAALSTARTVLAGLAKPAFLRNAEGRLVYGNPAYHDLAASLGKAGTEAKPAELIDANGPRGGKPHSTVVMLGRAGEFELVEYPVDGGSAGYLHPRAQANAVAVTAVRDAGLSHLSGIIDALTTPDRHLQCAARTRAVQQRLCGAVEARSRLAASGHGRAPDPRQAAHRRRPARRARLPRLAAGISKSYELQKPESATGTCPMDAPCR